MLSQPKNINFVMPEISEEEFFDINKPEDEMLLSTGEWDNESENNGEKKSE